jgi:putative tricarboxylic transport membrane protein
MQSRDYRDIIGGSALTLAGLFYGIYAYTHYELGTLSRMDSGMFPMWIGYLMAALGLAIAVAGLLRKGEYSFPMIEWRTLVVVLASVAAFAFCVRHFGVVPAIIIQSVVVSLADNKLTIVKKLILAVTLAIVAVLIFRVGLDLPLHLFAWPF